MVLIKPKDSSGPSGHWELMKTRHIRLVSVSKCQENCSGFRNFWKECLCFQNSRKRIFFSEAVTTRVQNFEIMKDKGFPRIKEEKAFGH